MAADLAVLGARIRTLDPERPWASAVAITDGTIVAVGDDHTVRDACDATTELVDGSGLHVVPGLTDSHLHPFWGLAWSRGAELAGLNDLEEVRDALRRERDRVGPGQWVLGRGLTYAAFAPHGGLHADLIEDAVGGNPAFLIIFDGHTALASHAAIRRAEIDHETTVAAGSEVVIGGDGRPTGELREADAMGLVREVVPAMTPSELRDAIRRVHGDMNRCGLVGIHGMDGTPPDFDLLRELEADGDLLVRMVLPLWQKPELTVDEMRVQLPLRDERGRLWRGGVAKFFSDGVIETGTAWLHEPDTQGRGTTCFWPDVEHLRAAIDLFARAGFQCATHAVGEAGVRFTLDCYRASGAAPGIRHRIEHIETLPREDMARFGAEGVTASMQILHMENTAPDRSDPWSVALGPDRTSRAFPAASIAAAGGLLALGSDWPVAHYDPRRGMAWARLRREPGRLEDPPYGADELLTPEQTLAGYTTAAARSVSEQDVAGMIREGYRGDLSAYAGDLIETAADDLPALPCLLTVVDGVVRHRV